MAAMEAETIDTIICPGCHAELAASDEVCSQCGAATTDKRPPEELINRPWVLIVLMLHVGLLGIPFYWKTKYSVGTRLLIILASIAYTVFAVTFIIWMLGYISRAFWG